MYTEKKPHKLLDKYIDAYWSIETTEGFATVTNRILPDTCTDIIINLGETIHTSNHEDTFLEGDKCYLLGTMTRFSDVTIKAHTRIVGIRFRPFAMHALLGFPLSYTSNKRIELGVSEFRFKTFVQGKKDSITSRLDAFFIDKLPRGHDTCPAIFDSIQREKGIVSVTALAMKHHITERQMERVFRSKAGVTVKELCNQVRLLNAIGILRNKKKEESLLSVALETGFYDHAHLNNSIKKYTGYSASHYSNNF